MKIHMNIDIKMNVISQRFIVEQDMSLLNVDLSRSIWMNNQNVYFYDVYKMCYRLRDSWNIKKKDISIFYAIDKKESSLILSMLNMQFKRIRIDMIARTWHFNVNEHAFELFFAQVFAKALQDEFIMYALVMINFIKESIIEHQVKAMNNVMSCIINTFEMQTLLNWKNIKMYSQQKVSTNCFCMKITIMQLKSLQNHHMNHCIICQTQS